MRERGIILRGLEKRALFSARRDACDDLLIEQLDNGIDVMSERKTQNFQEYKQLDRNARFLLTFVEPLVKALQHEIDAAPTAECLQPRGDFYPNTKRAQRGRKGWVELGEAKQMHAFAKKFGDRFSTVRRLIEEFRSGKLEANAEDSTSRKWDDLNAK